MILSHHWLGVYFAFHLYTRLFQPLLPFLCLTTSILKIVD